MNIVNIIMKNIENEYRGLLSEILNTGMDKEDRTGTGTRSIFGRTIRHQMADGFPLLTGKKVSFNAARTELLWILQGRTDLKYLEDNGVKYWRPDYERSGRTDETLGPVYGKQWRDFEGVDQLKNIVYSIKNNPSSRRLMVSAWAPQDMKDMALPPCHYAFQIYINNGKLDLMWMQYGLLLEMLAKGADLIPGELRGQFGDCHLYNNHLEQAKLYLSRPNRALPQLELESGINISSDKSVVPDYLNIPHKFEIKLINYNPYAAIKAELSVGK